MVRSRCAHVIRPVSYADLSGRRVAVDTAVYMHALKARGDVVGQLVDLNIDLVTNGVVPIFIFDGDCKVRVCVCVCVCVDWYAMSCHSCVPSQVAMM
jgi:hypothetical protein